MERDLNFIDRMFAAVSPEKALNREVARKRLEILNTGYSNYGANNTKKSMRGWHYHSRSPKEDIDANINVLRQKSRDAFMGGAPLATGAIKTVRTNVIGSGLILKPSIDAQFLKMTEKEAEAWKANVEREFAYWTKGENCDLMGVRNFYDIQQLAFISMLLSGDTFALLPFVKRKNHIYDLKIQLIEADRVGTPSGKLYDPNISEGVEIIDNQVRAYYVFDKHPGTYNFNGKYKRVPVFGENSGRRNILILMEAERPEQTRGVPYLAPVLESLKQMGRYSESELTAAVVGSMFTVFVKSETPQVGIGESIPENEQIDRIDENSLELGPGSIVNLGLNEDITIANPDRPNSGFDNFVTAFSKQVGAALEIPFELLLKHFSASYSASRAALLEAWKMFRMRRTWMVNNFCQPIYEEWLAEAVAKGRINAPGFFSDPIIRDAYCAAKWHGPSQGQIDPLKEVNAAIKRIDNNLSTGEKEAAELTSTDYMANLKQREREITYEQQLQNLKGGENKDERKN